MNISNSMQQSSFTSQLQSNSNVQAQSATSGFSPETSNTSRAPIIDSVQFSDISKLLSQKESTERSENDGDGDDAKISQSASLQSSLSSLSSLSQLSSSQQLDTLLQSNNTKQNNDFQSLLMKNILSAYSSNSSANIGISMRA